MKITIIGAGPGGYETAIAAAKAGIETVLVESGHVGGTCLNAGCIPTKALCRSARFAGELRDSAGLGIAVSGFHVDFSAVMARKNAIVEQLRTGVGTMLSAAGVTFVSGRAVLKDAHTVDVSGSLFNSDYIIIATGSSPAALAVAVVVDAFVSGLHHVEGYRGLDYRREIPADRQGPPRRAAYRSAS